MHFVKMAGVLVCTFGLISIVNAGEPLTPIIDEELPGAIQKCYAASVSDNDLVECNEAEAEYWDKVLNHNYKAAQKACSAIAEDYYVDEEQVNFAKKCKDDLKKTQLTWIKYRDAMSDIQCRLSPSYMGTMQKVDCASSYTQIVKEQALKLGRVYSNELL